MKECGSVMRMGRARRGGFTLTEILVALAIMVILFALLFAPMMVGLDWVTTGRANVNLQDACRLAMEQMRREISEAVYVHPTPGVDFSGADGTWGTDDDTRIPNYSQILFNPPARDGSGRVVNPPQAAVDAATGLPLVVRYTVRQVYTGVEYSDSNPFALYRQEFLWDTGQAYPLGSFDSAAVWMPDVPLVENALTPSNGATFLPSTTVTYTVAGPTDPTTPTVWAGYYDPGTLAPDERVMYLFEGLQFRPERISGERLTSTNGVLYRSKYAGWDGTTLGRFGWEFLPNTAINRSDLDPTIMLYSWDYTTGGYTNLAAGMNSRVSLPRTVRLRWSADSGSLTCGQQARTGVTGGWAYYKPIDFSTASPGSGWYAVSTPSEITAIRPVTGLPQDAANAPIAYRVDPSQDGTGWAALVQPGSVRVRVVATEQGTGLQRTVELKPTANFDQTKIRGDEYCPLIYRRDYNGDGAPEGTCAEIRLSRFDPPRPTSKALFGDSAPTLSGFQLQVVYYYRRNYAYDPTLDAAGRDPFVSDLAKVDYSTRTIQNVTMTLQRHVELEETGTPGVYALPPNESPNAVPLREQVIVRNFPRNS